MAVSFVELFLRFGHNGEGDIMTDEFLVREIGDIGNLSTFSVLTMTFLG